MKTLRLFATVAALALPGLATAEIYRYVDPVTGAVEFINYPKPGAVRMTTGDTPSEAPPVKRTKDPAQAKRDAQRQAAYAQLAKDFPTACKPRGERAYCDPQPGMPIDVASVAFGMRANGFTHTAAGRIDKWAGPGRCAIEVVGGKISRIDC